MFDIPKAKRVRRDELYSDSGHSSGDESDDSHKSPDSSSDHNAIADVAADLFRQRLGSLLGADSQELQAGHLQKNVEEAGESQKMDQDASEDKGFEFNLFAPTTAAKETSAPGDTQSQSTRQRIQLSPPPGDPNATDYLTSRHKQQRPLSYYFAGSPDAETERRFRLAALDADFIRNRAKQPWPDGQIIYEKKPWKISIWLGQNVAAGSNQVTYKAQAPRPDFEEQPRKRTRAGKKTRIRRRIVAARKARKDEEKVRHKEEEVRRQREKEEHIRAKKSETNRKKQIRKRQKERERKATEQSEVVNQKDASEM